MLTFLLPLGQFCMPINNLRKSFAVIRIIWAHQ